MSAVPSDTGAASQADDASKRFVEASRRMARTLRSRPAPESKSIDPGAALIDLLAFADTVAASQPARPGEPLEFPVMARLVEKHRDNASS